MPKNMSSSSSEDEEEDHSPSAEPVKETEKKITRYECPADFVSLCHVPCSSTLTDTLKNNNSELWLIKAPASFDPKCFSGIKVPLSGLQTLKVPTAAAPGSRQQIYSILASNHGTSELHLLTSDKQAADGMVLGPTFSGLLNVCESYGDSSTNQAPRVIPASPAPSIPAGLKQRFHPFGSKTPTLTCVAENEVDGAAFGPSSTTLRPLVVKRFIEETRHEAEEDEEEGRKKKKKKKKEKRVKTEQMEEGLKVKEEPEEVQEEVMEALPFLEGDDLGEKRKKKKKKKDRERELVEEGLEPSVRVKVEEVSVKSEPIDILCGEAAGGSERKKKKKKKKSKTDDD
ncbi:DNA-directed RNA polymerase I subunit RPA34 [Leuresthes tenuis]|uniref:DNA-directed RNA polymerase I subunit RPA34 n=1 Tax=Leuresthes tenuis TaxID=355514 RepID=UPI003B51265D